MPSVISLVTDRFLLRRCRRPLAFIKKEQRCKRNGEKPLRFDDFSVLVLTIFSIKLLLLGQTHEPWYLSPQTDFCHAAAVTRSRILKQSGNAKRMVRNNHIFSIFQFFYSPFFQLNCYFWGYHVICDISAQRRIFVPPPPLPSHVHENRAAMQKEWREIIALWSFSSSSNHLFSIKLLFSVRTRDPWYLCSQTEFRPPAASARLRLLTKNSDAKCMVRNHCNLTISQFIHSPFFQLNCYIWGNRAIRDISAHRRIFAPPPLPPASVY
jgi:hypothetical protein